MMLKAFASTMAAAALTFAVSAPLHASASDYQTRFTFNTPIALPGVTLPAGTYIFKLADPVVNRKVVQVLDESGRHSYALLNAIAAERRDAADMPTVGLMSTVAGMPTAVKTWWPEGTTSGFEFVFPEEQMMKLTGVTPVDQPEATLAKVTVPQPTLPTARSASRAAARSAASTAQPEFAPPVPFADVQSPVAPAQQVSPLPFVTILGALALVGGAWALGRSKA